MSCRAGKDIVKALLAEKPKEGTGEVFETENGVEYEDLLIGPPGEGAYLFFESVSAHACLP